MSNQKVSCICLTFNRPKHLDQMGLLQEAVESFAKQDWDDKELVVVNDTPGQELTCSVPQVKIVNLDERCKNLSEKIQIGINHSEGQYLTRWDDDDISLPWRLSLSMRKLIDSTHNYRWGRPMHWKSTNYWWARKSKEQWLEIDRPGNTHTMAVWSKWCLDRIGGYPQGFISGEDQAFDEALRNEGLEFGERLSLQDMYYVYRWGVSNRHLSGDANHERHWKNIGNEQIAKGSFVINPLWKHDYVRKHNRCAKYQQIAL